MDNMTRAELVEAGYEMTGGSVETLTLDQLYRLTTVTQFVTDFSLAEIERRGELTFAPEDGAPIVPYYSEHMVAALTR